VLESLFAKTFAILGLQLLVTYLGAEAYPQLVDLVGVEWEKRLRLFLLGSAVVSFLILLVTAGTALSVRLPLFSLWSLFTGMLVGAVLSRSEERLGARALAATAGLAVICFLFGTYSGVRFSALEKIAFFLLVGLLVANTLRLFKKMAEAEKGALAFVGVVVFSAYLLIDFSRLADLQKAGRNDWSTAMDLAIAIYLDLINLFLQLLELLGES